MDVLLQYVKEQNAEICMIALKNNGLALEYVQEQNPELCMIAVKQDGLALKYVKAPTYEICLEAVKAHPLALDYIQEKTIELCLEAVKCNIQALTRIHDTNIINNICSSLDILYLPFGAPHRELILRLVNGKYRCWIGCQENISLENLKWRIHNTDGGLTENPHRQHYIDFLTKHNLYNAV